MPEPPPPGAALAELVMSAEPPPAPVQTERVVAPAGHVVVPCTSFPLPPATAGELVKDPFAAPPPPATETTAPVAPDGMVSLTLPAVEQVTGRLRPGVVPVVQRAIGVGVTDALADDSAELPTTLMAWTVKVYAVPLVRPVTVHGAVVQVPVKLPGVEIAVYPVIADPPVLDGAVKVTEACVLLAVADTAVGGPGAVGGVTEFDAADSAESPAALVACTVNVYVVPAVRPLIAHGDDVHVPAMLPGVDVAV